ncbi:ABC transporter permease subunit [Paenibacillus aurantius]|uniref:ABC transporter permease subunit n=1 Tax=Paenibacillus aurantius TaxID=2918900 RepID=A0AA96LIZ1_9BACL|nr:ABC transporter permease subunit [Paenibacillus aurantius]WNQ14239.1 ABC transporter permease subunit [Paenibacillus aurantius]
MPGVVLTFIFHYLPMYGVIIAFKNYNPIKGIWGSDWVGLRNFTELFDSPFFWRAFKNTLILNGYQILFAFPAPIVFALLLNEIRSMMVKRWMQTITYFPHFLSWVVIGGFVVAILSPNTGILTTIQNWLSYEGSQLFLLTDSRAFRAILVISEIWKNVGWGAIIYLAAITGVNPEYYDAAVIDGAGRWKQTLHVTLPAIMPTIIILLVLRIGNMMGSDFEQILVLYSANVYDVGDVLSTYVFRLGLFQGKYSFTTAVGLFQSVIGFTLIMIANRLSRRVGGGLW